MTDTLVDLAAARAASDQRDADLKATIDELVEASHVLSAKMNDLRDAVAQDCDGETLIDLARCVAAADSRVEALSTHGWAIGHRRIAR